jgi:hypothetical protein
MAILRLLLLPFLSPFIPLSKYGIECRREQAVRHVTVEDRVHRGMARERMKSDRGAVR